MKMERSFFLYFNFLVVLSVLVCQVLLYDAKVHTFERSVKLMKEEAIHNFHKRDTSASSSCNGIMPPDYQKKIDSHRDVVSKMSSCGNLSITKKYKLLPVLTVML